MKETKVKEFKNFSDEAFTCGWDGVNITLKPGQSLHMEDWKADHFAKHLVDREMYKENGNRDDLNVPSTRNKFLVQALPVDGEEVDVSEIIDKNVKKAKKTKKVEKEAEFEDLD